MRRRHGLTALLAMLAVGVSAVPDVGAQLRYTVYGGHHVFGSDVNGFTGQRETPQTLGSYPFQPCPAPGTPNLPNFVCLGAFAKADLVDGRRVTLHAATRLTRIDANGVLPQELVYAGAGVAIYNMGTVTASPVGYAYVNLGLTGFRSQFASHPSLVPEAYSEIRVNNALVQCFADSCRVRAPYWEPHAFSLELRSDARVTNPEPGVLTGWDAEMIADFSDTLELRAIELHDVNDQPIPGAQLWVVDDQGNRLFDIPTTVEPTTTTLVTTPTTSSSVTTTSIPDGSTTTSSSTSTTSSTVTTSTVPLDHFRCYPGKTAKGTPKFGSRTVRLADDLEDKSTLVDSVASLCNPADKGGEGIADPTAHLACYKIKQVTKKPRFVARDVVTVDQFGSLSLRVSSAATLCVPSEKDGVPSPLPVDHFKCYRAKVMKGTPSFKERTVAVTDQFETKNVVVLKPLALCAAVRKNEEGVRRPSDRLVCYETKDVKGQSGFAKRTAAVRNQFGHLVLEVKKPKTICLPAVEGSGPSGR